jgi:hypothetical protein
VLLEGVGSLLGGIPLVVKHLVRAGNLRTLGFRLREGRVKLFFPLKFLCLVPYNRDFYRAAEGADATRKRLIAEALHANTASMVLPHTAFSLVHSTGLEKHWGYLLPDKLRR